MVKPFFSKHRKLWSAVLVALVLIAALAVNLLLPYLQHASAFYPDLTPEGLYTVSDLMHVQMQAIQAHLTKTGRSVDIIFCADRDILLSHYDTRYVYVLAQKLAKAYPGIRVETRSVQTDPSSVNEFRATSGTEIGWNDVIISSATASGGKQYRVMNAANFWSSEEGVYTNFNGEFKFASAFLSLTAFDEAPMACFTVGHGEKYYDITNPAHKDNPELEAFAQSLMDLGMKVGTVNLDTEEIPSDCVLLIMNGPTEDYADREEHLGDLSYVSAMEKVDRHLAGYQAFMVLKDPEAGVLPGLNAYLEEWGLAFREGVVRDSSPSGALQVASGAALNNREYLVASYATAENGTIGYSMYQTIADRATSPKTVLERCSPVEMLWGDLGEKIESMNVSRMVSGLFFSSPNVDERGLPTAAAYVGESFSERDLSLSHTIPLAAVSVEKKMGDEVDYYHAYVIAVGTTKLISSDYFNNASFCNYETVFSMLRTVSRTDRYADADLGGLTMNSDRYGGKALWLDELKSEKITNWYTDNDRDYQFTYQPVTNVTRGVVTAVLSILVVAIPLVGIVVHRRRKYR